MKRVNEEKLEYVYEEYGVALLNGESFTGESIEKSGDTIISLTTFTNGAENGPKKEWYENGQIRLMGETRFPKGAVGTWKKWSETGQLTEKKIFDEEGNLIRRQQWDMQGTLLKDDSYDPLW
ncbi:MAG TPA: hypothetical protein VK054_01680 [Beutenbergiaceae bacterium]|nr:hypothetical protein [Beutenbergiaceae bacterium]